MCCLVMTITDTALVHYSAPALAALLEAIKRACEGKSGTAGVKKTAIETISATLQSSLKSSAALGSPPGDSC